MRHMIIAAAKENLLTVLRLLSEGVSRSCWRSPQLLDTLNRRSARDPIQAGHVVSTVQVEVHWSIHLGLCSYTLPMARLRHPSRQMHVVCFEHARTYAVNKMSCLVHLMITFCTVSPMRYEPELAEHNSGCT